ncbi:hypothetical protein H5410_038606 [Solanum commersonii]|uniref:PGG domain-containing protein n=1 Tax=Solanum commersonii TaxID=4109 RepID=A0A9J5YEE6_SOLCO|nr:hypothetical protein H5410_038606 [Solanum commersonii]
MAFNKQNQTPLDIVMSRTRTITKVKLVAGLCGTNARLGQRCDFEEDAKAIAKRAKSEVDKILKSTEIQVVVATLIMRVSFTAGFTLPGGLEDNDDGPNKGMATLIKKTASNPCICYFGCPGIYILS